MQQLYGFALASLAGLVFVGGYHALVVGPRLRALDQRGRTHDALIGGGADRTASARLDAALGESSTLRGRVEWMERRLDEIDRVLANDVHRVGFVRYNAFPDVGSELSYALALLNREGNGVILTSIFSREETRTYGKAVERFATLVDASVEEKLALDRARTAA